MSLLGVRRYSARGNEGELSIAFDLDCQIIEEPRRFGSSVESTPSIRLRGLSPLGSSKYPAFFLAPHPQRHVGSGDGDATTHGGPHDDHFEDSFQPGSHHYACSAEAQFR